MHTWNTWCSDHQQTDLYLVSQISQKNDLVTFKFKNHSLFPKKTCDLRFAVVCLNPSI